MRALLLALVAAMPAQLLAVTPEELFLPPHGDEGCWVSFFDGPGFAPPSAQLRGRSFVESFETATGGALKPELAHVGGEEFFRGVQSLVVGPHARFVGYAEPNYRHRALVIGPRGQVADLAAIDFHERVRSFKIFCEASAAS